MNFLGGMKDDKKRRKNEKKKNKQTKNNVDIRVGETVIKDHNLVNYNGKYEHASLIETVDDSIVDRETGNGDHNLASNARDEHANLSDDALNSIMDRETGNRDHNHLVNDAKDDHANISEAVVNSNGDGESSTRDQNQVNNSKEDSTEFLSTTHGQSVSEDWDSDWNWDVEVPNKDLNVDFNVHLPNGHIRRNN